MHDCFCLADYAISHLEKDKIIRSDNGISVTLVRLSSTA